MAGGDDALVILRSIDATLKQMLALAQQRTARATHPAATPGTPSVNIDDPKHGDPVIKAKDPRDWTGPSMNGKRFSECPPEYLDLLADRFEYFNTQPDIAPDKKKYNALDAARARAWAARLRSGWTPLAERANPWGGSAAQPQPSGGTGWPRESEPGWSDEDRF